MTHLLESLRLKIMIIGGWVKKCRTPTQRDATSIKKEWTADVWSHMDDLRIIKWKERSQRKMRTHRMILFIWNSEKCNLIHSEGRQTSVCLGMGGTEQRVAGKRSGGNSGVSAFVFYPHCVDEFTGEHVSNCTFWICALYRISIRPQGSCQ